MTTAAWIIIVVSACLAIFVPVLSWVMMIGQLNAEHQKVDFMLQSGVGVWSFAQLKNWGLRRMSIVLVVDDPPMKVAIPSVKTDNPDAKPKEMTICASLMLENVRPRSGNIHIAVDDNGVPVFVKANKIPALAADEICSELTSLLLEIFSEYRTKLVGKKSVRELAEEVRRARAAECGEVGIQEEVRE